MPENQRALLEMTVQSSRMIDRRLRILQVVAERGTISAAADDLGYTPSAVSHQLRTLARDLGVRLLEPAGRNVRLTPAARVLLQRTEGLMTSWEQIRAEVLQVSSGRLGHLRMAGFSTAASALLAPVAATAREVFPQSEIEVIEADPDTCFDLLLAEQADVVVVVGLERLPATLDVRFEQHALLADPLDLLVPPDHALAHQEEVTLADAAGEDWIMARPGGPYHRLATSACHAAGFLPRQTHRAMEWDTCSALVAAGLGVALIPRLARIPEADGLVRVPLLGPSPPMRYLRMCIRHGAAEQPEVAHALTALREVADRVRVARDPATG